MLLGALIFLRDREAAVLDLFEDKDGDQLRHKHWTWHGLSSSATIS